MAFRQSIPAIVCAAVLTLGISGHGAAATGSGRASGGEAAALEYTELVEETSTEGSAPAVEAEERLEKIIADWAEALAVRVVLLSRMEDPRERRLLELRYLHGLSIEDICVRLNMERMQVWRVQGSALEHFREVYERGQKGEK